MARNRYIKTYSNYVIKDIHQNTNIGTIYERDFMTISDLNSYAPGSLPAYGLNGFKMVINDTLNLKKKHHYGNWVKNDACESKSMYWTLECMGDNDNAQNDEKHIKPNMESVLDFSCFGSSYKMIESAVKGVMTTFPGELFLTDVKIKMGNTVFYLVDNPFNIEMDKILLSDKNDIDIMRVFSRSYDKYIFQSSNGRYGYVSWNMNMMPRKECLNNEMGLSMIDLGKPLDDNLPNLLLYYYIYDGKKVLLHDGSYINGRITPNSNVKRDYFSKLNGFEKVLLNKKTNYTAVLETPEETDKGNVMRLKSYTWPKSSYGDWNIDVSGAAFYEYFSSLLSIGEFYDKYFSNNIWRSLTHEAIINFDWTLTTVDENGVTDEMTTPHSERMEAFIHVAGRAFDDLKQCIDGISRSNAVTYNECGNKPDARLKDDLELYGWDVKAPISTDVKNFISDVLYPGHTDGFTIDEANKEFYRRLLLNTNAILSAKGTKKSIEMIMAMFGYYSKNFLEHSYHDIIEDGEVKTLKWNDVTDEYKKKVLRYSYDMTEYVFVANEESNLWGDDKDEQMQNVKTYNKRKLSYDFNNEDEYQGLPVKEVIMATNNEVSSYLIPWYDKDTQYDGDIYFESKGGWGLKQTMIGYFNDYDEIVIDTDDNFKVYDESVKYLKFVNTIDDLQQVLFEYPNLNDIYYVYDITDGGKYDWGYLTKISDGVQISEPLHTMSHYFILKNVDYTHLLGVLKNDNGLPLINTGEYDENGVIKQDSMENHLLDDFGFPVKEYGWKNISEEELKIGKSSDAKRVYYLESIIENSKGNNPHVGFGKYDGGDTYKQYFEDIFKGIKDDDTFIDDSLIDNAKVGFALEKQIDNVKCWYFTDTFNEQHSLTSIEFNSDGEIIDHGYHIPDVIIDDNFIRNTKMDEKSDTERLFSSKQYKTIEPFNMEPNGKDNDEAAANSIINSKQFFIEFVPDMSSPESMFDFIENSVMHYVKQVVPSTTILKYYVPMREMNVNCYHRTYLQSAIIKDSI